MNRSIWMLAAFLAAGCSDLTPQPTPVPLPPSVAPRDRLLRDESMTIPSAAPSTTAGSLPTG